MNEIAQFIQSSTISEAWFHAFKLLTDRGINEITPLVISIDLDHQKDIEVLSVRDGLDRLLDAGGNGVCETVANTIFPLSLWNPSMSRSQLFDRYLRIYPRIKRVIKNRYGTYFQRLIAYGPNQDFNQLEYVIRTYERGHARRSALQAATFDPLKDSTGQALRGFPCMQHISFAPYGDGLLAITAFYTTQYIFERAYGNYLGLYHLGKFMAQEMGLRLGKVNCTASIALRGDITKQDARAFIDHTTL